jgi:glycosyltransferase involved in cell wall biosynthesis
VRGGSDRPRSAKVVRVHLDDGLRPLEVEERYQSALLIVLSREGFLGQVLVPAEPVLTVERQWDAITRELEQRLWARQVRGAFINAVSGLSDERPDRGDPTVSVIVCTRDRPHDLRSCLDSIAALRTRPREVIVVDNSPSDVATRELCRDYPVRYVPESRPGLARARNRGIVEAGGEVVAFTDDDCVVDRHWLDGLGDPFNDPLVMALTGYAGPLELETPAQYLFEVHGGFQRFSERRLFDGASSCPMSVAAAAGAGANSLFRRSVFEEVGLFAEDLGPGTPARNGEEKYTFYRIAAAGYRIIFDPVRIVWHRHRTELASLRRTLFGYTTGEFAYTTRCLLAHGELGTVDLWRWWRRHLADDLRRWVRDDERALPLDVILAEAAGLSVGPWKLLRSRRSRRSTRALARAEGRRSPDAERAPPRVGAEAPRLSVVIASRNRRERLRQVLAGLADQRYPADRFEAVVVLDGSSDGSSEMVRGLDLPYEVARFEQEHSGVAKSRNRGAHEASHPVVLFLDDDILPELEFLAEHAAAHQAGREPIVLGYYPPVLQSSSLWGYALRAWWEDHFRRKAEPEHQWTYIDYADGNVSMPKALLFRCGGYDESFRGRRQDWELGIRLLSEGATFAYHPGAKGQHYLDTRFETALRHARQEGRDDVRLASKHPHVKGQLPLAGVAESGPGIPGGPFVAPTRRATAERALRAGPVALDVLERLRLRHRWHKLGHRLHWLSYLLGVADALPSRERFEDFFAPVWRGDHMTRLPVWLDAQASLRVPPGAGPLELQIGYAGKTLAGTRALEPAGQWDWGEVTERVVWAASGPMRRARLLTDLGPGDPRPPSDSR